MIIIPFRFHVSYVNGTGTIWRSSYCKLDLPGTAKGARCRSKQDPKDLATMVGASQQSVHDIILPVSHMQKEQITTLGTGVGYSKSEYSKLTPNNKYWEQAVIQYQKGMSIIMPTQELTFAAVRLSNQPLRPKEEKVLCKRPLRGPGLLGVYRGRLQSASTLSAKQRAKGPTPTARRPPPPLTHHWHHQRDCTGDCCC